MILTLPFRRPDKASRIASRPSRRPRRGRSPSMESMENRLLLATQVFHDAVPSTYPADLQLFTPIIGLNRILSVPQFDTTNRVLLAVTVEADIALTETTTVTTDAAFPVNLNATANLGLTGAGGVALTTNVNTGVTFIGPGTRTNSDSDRDPDSGSSSIVLHPGDAAFAQFVGAGNVNYLLQGNGGLTGTVVLPPVGSTSISITTSGGGQITVTY